MPEEKKESSITSALEETQTLFTGHPAADLTAGSPFGEAPKEEEEATVDDGEAGKSKESSKKGDDTSASEEKSAKEPLPGEETVPDAAAKEGEGKSTGDGEGGTEFKYQSQEEAEKAYKEAEKKMHEALVEGKKVREELAALKKVTKEKKPLKKTSPEGKDDDTAFEEMLKAVDDLDPYDDNYHKDLAKLWTKTIDGALMKKEAAAEEGQDEQGETEKQEEEAFVAEAITVAEKAGLSMGQVKGEDGELADSPDAVLFWSAADKSKGETFEERVEWSIKEVIRLKSKIVGEKDTLRKKAKETQKKNEVLGEGAAAHVKDKKEGPVTPLTIEGAVEKTTRRI